MTGWVSRRRALVLLTFLRPSQPDEILEVVIDTGFTGSLALPPALVTALGLRHVAEQPAGLADGTAILVPVYVATIVWNGGNRVVPVLALGQRPLIGTALLDDHHLGIEFVDAGAVTITPRP